MYSLTYFKDEEEINCSLSDIRDCIAQSRFDLLEGCLASALEVPEELRETENPILEFQKKCIEERDARLKTSLIETRQSAIVGDNKELQKQ